MQLQRLRKQMIKGSILAFVFAQLHSGYCEKKDEEEKALLDFLLWITPKHGFLFNLNHEVIKLLMCSAMFQCRLPDSCNMHLLLTVVSVGYPLLCVKSSKFALRHFEARGQSPSFTLKALAFAPKSSK